MLKLLKRLEIGLLTVALDSPLKTVDVVLTPSDSLAWKNRKKRERLQVELENRQVSANTGGMNRRKIVTAYREKHCICAVFWKIGKPLHMENCGKWGWKKSTCPYSAAMYTTGLNVWKKACTAYRKKGGRLWKKEIMKKL